VSGGERGLVEAINRQPDIRGDLSRFGPHWTAEVAPPPPPLTSQDSARTVSQRIVYD
jgi:hypothetical protein